MSEQEASEVEWLAKEAEWKRLFRLSREADDAYAIAEYEEPDSERSHELHKQAKDAKAAADKAQRDAANAREVMDAFTGE